MRGEVRLLLFWLGRDNAGGGHIRVARSPGRQDVEVLFGSDPARVPGRINRWGFGRESASLEPSAPASVFEGVMRYSPEQSLSQARQSSGTGILYQAILSEVRPGAASSQVRLFELQDTLDFRSAPSGLAGLLRAVSARPPTRTRSLAHSEPRPWGLLTTLYSLTRDLASAPPSAAFVYNARSYRLDIRRRRILPESAHADFEITNLETGNRTPFSLEVPRHGEWAGIPTRIVFQPRWWLRLRLDLISRQP